MSDETNSPTLGKGRRPRRFGMWLAGVFFLSCVYFLPWVGDWEQNARLDLSLAIVNKATLSIDGYRSSTRDVAVSGKHYYSITAPGQSLLGVPVAAGFKELLNVSSPAAERDWTSFSFRRRKNSLRDLPKSTLLSPETTG